jgi:hypothetical protein
MPEWRRDMGHELQPGDIPELKDKDLNHLVIGCGVHGVLKIQPAATKLFEELGLGWSALKTPAAVEAYNKRVAAGEKVAGLY